MELATLRHMLPIGEARASMRMDSYTHLVGKPATLYYLPTHRSRAWQRGFFTQNFSEVAFRSATRIANAAGWYAIHFKGE